MAAVQGGTQLRVRRPMRMSAHGAQTLAAFQLKALSCMPSMPGSWQVLLHQCLPTECTNE